MFVRTAEQKHEQLLLGESLETGRALVNWWAARHDLSTNQLLALSVRLEQNGRRLADWDAPLTAAAGPVTILVGGGLPGGKGGFGSMLRYLSFKRITQDLSTVPVLGLLDDQF